MKFPREVWKQLKSITASELRKALIRDGWEEERGNGGIRGYGKPSTNGSGRRRRVTIHYHPKKTYGAKLLQGLMDDTGWTQGDLERLRLIKKAAKAKKKAR